MTVAGISFIPLSQGQITVIDAADYDQVKAKLWHAQWDAHTKSFYARASHGGPLMHRFILGLTDPAIQCDHWNGNTLDNRRENLRPATHSQNRHNRSGYKNTKSGRAGVHWHKRDKKWAVYINIDGTRVYLGYFKDEREAIERRKQAELEMYGDFAFSTRPNVGGWDS